MIDLSETLGWLSAIDNHSYLNDEARRLIKEGNMLDRSDRRAKWIVERLRGAGQSSREPLEKAEILLHCAGIAFLHGWHMQAANDANVALLACQNDEHRRGVAHWILGAVQWKLNQNDQAQTNWVKARKIFGVLQVLYQNLPDQRDWYRNGLRQMGAEAVLCPEEIETWLNCFEVSSLALPTKQIVQRVRTNICKEPQADLYALIGDLKQAIEKSKNAYERAEVCLEFGLVLYQTRHISSAIDVLRRSVQNYIPGIGIYHKQVVARLMLGAVERLDSSTYNQAVDDWKRSIAEFEQLRVWAERDKLQQKMQWYAERLELLKAAFSTRSRQPRRSRGIPKGPSASPSDAHEFENYRNLVSLVGGNTETANGLIEYERQRFPRAGLDELIERAIERLLRDRR